ncbi:alkaline phosphatase family protein [Terricaulis silvestris]|uniref:Phosphoglyceromutase n=1 Tax=Terricaulis silvestris TaxID=2686094 RepID=A0A6I6N1B1_9CAUL|nr:hypothetical protein [Terricaulis silvestris]QGZ97113.1 hypothetical protein DSM104635_03979 [Terricaulis silvestris]
MRGVLFALAALAALSSPALAQEPPKNVVLVTIDGLRWEELFRGADPDLVRDAETRARYVDVPDRAQALAPFLLGFAQTGALIGNRDAGSCALVSNDFWFSYPGYAEMLGGRPNPRVRYNAAIQNDDVTVLERLIRRPEFADQVRVFAEWNAVPAIVNTERSGIPVSLPPDYEAPHDPQVMTAAREVLADLPRVTWINLGGTDTNAHAGRYPDYLASASAADAFLSELWTSIETNPRTAGRTTLIVTTDHGRGASARNRWRGHGSGRWRGIVVPGLRHVGSDAVWIAARGPGIGGGSYGMENCATVSQVAATMLRSIDLDEERQSDMAPALDVFATAP